MAKILPETFPGGEWGEERVYDALSQLPDPWVVIYDVGFVHKDPGRPARGGQADFVLVHPDHGVVVFEVKGGEIVADGGSWTTTNKSGTYPIKDPFDQANRNKYDIKELITVGVIAEKSPPHGAPTRSTSTLDPIHWSDEASFRSTRLGGSSRSTSPSRWRTYTLLHVRSEGGEGTSSANRGHPVSQEALALPTLAERDGVAGDRGTSPNETVIVRFDEPVDGVDPATGERFTSNRHVVMCTAVLQTHEWTRFLTAGDAEAARWPTARVQSIRWPEAPERRTHDHATHSTAEPKRSAAPAPAETDHHTDGPPSRDRRLEERLAARRLWAATPIEATPPELAGWDDISDKTLALGNQTTRARHWDAVPTGARDQCPVCGDRLVGRSDHACLG